MPRFFFNLNDGHKIIRDPEGTELPDRGSAREHAYQVVRELARNRERMTSSWRLAVYDAHGVPCFELLFASVDDSISKQPPAMRMMVENACRNTASLDEAIRQVVTTLSRVKGPWRNTMR